MNETKEAGTPVTEGKKKDPLLKEFVETLNGMDIETRIPPIDIKYAKDNGAVIVLSSSENSVEFRGAISDEVYRDEDGTIYFSSAGELVNICTSDKCPYFMDLVENASQIEVKWNSDGYMCVFETDIPHETFEILNGGEKYCCGIVFMIDDVKEKI